MHALYPAHVLLDAYGAIKTFPMLMCAQILEELANMNALYTEAKDMLDQVRGHMGGWVLALALCHEGPIRGACMLDQVRADHLIMGHENKRAHGWLIELLLRPTKMLGDRVDEQSGWAEPRKRAEQGAAMSWVSNPASGDRFDFGPTLQQSFPASALRNHLGITVWGKLQLNLSDDPLSFSVPDSFLWSWPFACPVPSLDLLPVAPCKTGENR